MALLTKRNRTLSLEFVRDYIAMRPDDRLTPHDVAHGVLNDHREALAAEADNLIIRQLCAVARKELKASGSLADAARQQYHLPLDFMERRLPARISVPPIEIGLDIESDDDLRIQWVPLWKATKAEVKRHHQLLMNNERAVRTSRLTMADLIDFLDYKGVKDDDIIGDVLKDGFDRDPK